MAMQSRSFQLNQSNNRSPVDFYCTCHGCCWVQCVRTNEAAIITQFGEFHNIRYHWLLCLPCWPFTRVEKRLSLRIQQLDLTCETKTKDNGKCVLIQVVNFLRFLSFFSFFFFTYTLYTVFVTVDIAILYKVDDPYKAYYSLTNPEIQIQSYVFDQVRSTIPSLDIDDLYTTSQDVSLDILRSLQFFMVATYGYDIMNVLILNLYPTDVKVRSAMNAINACKRMKEAMVNRGETG